MLQHPFRILAIVISNFILPTGFCLLLVSSLLLSTITLSFNSVSLSWFPFAFCLCGDKCIDQMLIQRPSIIKFNNYHSYWTCAACGPCGSNGATHYSKLCLTNKIINRIQSLSLSSSSLLF